MEVLIGDLYLIKEMLTKKGENLDVKAEINKKYGRNDLNTINEQESVSSKIELNSMYGRFGNEFK